MMILNFLKIKFSNKPKSRVSLIIKIEKAHYLFLLKNLTTIKNYLIISKEQSSQDLQALNNKNLNRKE